MTTLNPPSFDRALLANCQQRIQQLLTQYLPCQQDSASLHQAMRHGSLNGGKRLRPLLVYLGAQLYGVAWSQVDIVALATELIHCYSLVHDDLPAMDNDDLRRGQPTTHRVFGEANAILAGNGLLTLAIELVTQADELAVDTRLNIIQTLCKAAGAKSGMLLGQALDLQAEGQNLACNAINAMHRAKTGALIAASVQCGAIASERASQTELKALYDFGHALGLAFQIHDDILDLTGESDTLGKQTGQDLKQNKATYVTQQGLTQSRLDAQQMADKAYAALAVFDASANPLRALCQYTIERAA